MLLIMLRKGRGAWTILRASITRRLRLKDNTRPVDQFERNAQATAHHDAHDTPTTISPDIHVTPPARRDTRCSDTNGIVNQLALLPASVTRSSPRATICSKRSSSPLSTNAQSTRPDGGNSQECLVEDVKSFHYLHSLITISCLPQQSSSGQTPIRTTIDRAEEQSPGRRRASSRLSLRLGDLPSLSFPKVPRKPRPRYTPLPPVYTPKPIAMRPEVRF
ncbi:hypothetical protein PMG11_03606 [Penicillium brasilianum]|uniref:Uncharacterized protein n=1 Tax=Penicillium brasilianum TaxID=104259 RepID=A0A0F7VDZ3_PENBI|nr:hypothetical protein PMG11_03606 [Penicillium brasilianum]